MNPFLLFFGTGAALSLYFLSWYFPAVSKRRNRLRVRLYQKMAEHQIDPWELSRIMGVKLGFVAGLLTGDQRIEAVAASGLVLAFPETDLAYWYELDSL